MINLNLENIEEKFYFKTSHFFWHLITGLAVVALVVGVLIFLWGLTPSWTPWVTKAAYPEPLVVSAEEVLRKIAPPAPETTSTSKSKKNDILVDDAAPAVVDSTESDYLAAIDNLKALLPPEKFPWKSSGHWEKKTWGSKKWHVDVWGITDRLKTVFKKVSANDFVAKKKLVDAYAELIAPFVIDQRYKVLKAAISFSKDNVDVSMANISLLQKSSARFSRDKAEFVETLATFGRKNPRDGKAFIEYIEVIMPQFTVEMRPGILKKLVSGYYGYFNNIVRQKEATDMFLPMVVDIDPADQQKALLTFYELYLKKNANRAQKVASIDRTYLFDMSAAERVVAEKRAAKVENRTLGLRVFGGSVVFIAFLALFLVLLSIQRNLKQLCEMTAVGAGK